MKCFLGISNFLEEISSLSRSIVFLYFFALIAEEGFLISPCYSLELSFLRVAIINWGLCVKYFTHMIIYLTLTKKNRSELSAILSSLISYTRKLKRKVREVVKHQDCGWTGACPAPASVLVATALFGGYEGHWLRPPIPCLDFPRWWSEWVKMSFPCELWLRIHTQICQLPHLKSVILGTAASHPRF